MSNPSDIARLGHRFQARFKHATSARTLVASRIQRFAPENQQQTEVYYELGSVDPVGEASESPQFQVAVDEYVHNCELDLLLAGKAAIDTAWTLFDYIGNGVLSAFLLERNNAGVVKNELEYNGIVISEIQTRWQMGQPIMSTYTMMGKIGKNWVPSSAPHNTWGVQDTTSPGGIRVKDARLFLGGETAGFRVYRLQGITMRTQFPATPVREIGSRPLVGFVVEPPRTTLDLDFLVADEQPDDILYAHDTIPATYYDYVNPQLLTNSAIRIYDPDSAEAAVVLRSWVLENLRPTNATPALAQVRGLATKRYSFVINRATTPNTGGLLMYVGDIP